MKHMTVTRMCILTLCAIVLTGSCVWAQQAAEYNNAGVEAYKSGDYGKAIGLLERAYDMTRESPVVRRNLCNAYQSQGNVLAVSGDFRGALRLVEAAIGVDSENASPFIQAGSYLLHLNEVNAAIQRLETAIQIKPGELDAHELLGQAYYMDNDLSSARAQWDYVLEMAPDRKGLAERYDKAFREESVELDFNRWKSRHFHISFPQELSSVMRSNIIGMLDRAYLDMGRQFGGVFPPPPIHVILYSAEQFREVTQLAGHIGAVYDGKIRSPLMDDKGEWLSEEELRRRLLHEYVHVLVRHIGGANVPWWLNEGLAESLTKSLTTQDMQQLRSWYGAGTAYVLGDLNENQVVQLNPDSLRQAYLQSHAAVELLWNRYGRSKMLALLRALGEGMAHGDAFQSVYRRNISVIERDLAAAYR